MKSKYVIWAVIIVIVIIIALKLSANKKKLDEKNNPAPAAIVRIPVKTDSVKEQLIEINILKTGNLTPFEEAKAVAMVAGTLREVRFQLGDQVSAGQVLAVTDTRSLQLDLQKAETNAAKLKSDLDTYVELYKGKAATREKVDGVRKDYLDAVNLVEQSKKNIADAAIRAPTAGIISVKPIESGVYVNSGDAIATIVNLSKAKVQVNLTETEVYKVTRGQKVKITTDVYPGKEFTGTVSFISPQADEAHNYVAEIMVENTHGSMLRSGTFVYADFSRKTKQQVLVIPREALTESVKNASVYIVESNMVHLKNITTGPELADGNIQVISGLHAGDRIVTSGQINLKEGTAISVSN